MLFHSISFGLGLGLGLVLSACQSTIQDADWVLKN
jgi:hypothetical protein